MFRACDFDFEAVAAWSAARVNPSVMIRAIVERATVALDT
jgi:hypothetical protein